MAIRDRTPSARRGQPRGARRPRSLRVSLVSMRASGCVATPIAARARRVCLAGRVTPGRRSRRTRGVFAALRHVGDMAIDLGTANTVVYVRGRGIVLSEPSVVAIDERTGDVLAVGSEAQLMIGRTPASISADRPLRHGVIADFEVTEAMLRRFMDKVLSSRFSRPRLVMCAPADS